MHVTERKINMFFKKKKVKTLLAVASGEVIKIDEVKDPVFSQKMMGNGFAIKTCSDRFYAPANGTINVLFPTYHAYGMTLEDGCEILVHIGLETVNENGQGFTSNVKVGDVVQSGSEIIKIDRNYLENKGYDLTTIIIFINSNSYQEFDAKVGEKVVGGKDIIATYK